MCTVYGERAYVYSILSTVDYCVECRTMCYAVLACVLLRTNFIQNSSLRIVYNSLTQRMSSGMVSEYETIPKHTYLA